MYGVGLVVELVHGLPCWNLTGDNFETALQGSFGTGFEPGDG
jgi:hypothetical protein